MRRPRLASLVLGCGLALSTVGFLPGCGLAEPGHRARDASQMLHVGLGVSLGPSLHTWALAPLFGTSLGYMQDSAWVGSDYGYAWGWHQAAYGVLIGGEMVRAEFGQSVEGFVDRPLYQTYATQTQLLLFNLVVSDERIGSEAQALSLRRAELGLHLLVVGASLGVDFVEIFDFGAGIFGWDPAGDDGIERRHAPFPLPPSAAERQEQARRDAERQRHAGTQGEGTGDAEQAGGRGDASSSGDANTDPVEPRP
ncbi:MAG: hypothetical protein DRQ55_02020 [Planctomycetota bacterium]|nr:MAG: hypothetical protein DRQ55_02020 [Planctomycetota bacterium]